jgi:hypothetical protein
MSPTETSLSASFGAVDQRRKIPNREWLGVVFPAACSVILLVAAITSAAGRQYGWIVVLSCFAAGAAFPLSYTLVLVGERRLYLGDTADIENNRKRIGTCRAIGWILGACFVAAGVGLGGVSKAAFLARLGGPAFRFWPAVACEFPPASPQASLGVSAERSAARVLGNIP